MTTHCIISMFITKIRCDIWICWAWWKLHGCQSWAVGIGIGGNWVIGIGIGGNSGKQMNLGLLSWIVNRSFWYMRFSILQWDLAIPLAGTVIKFIYRAEISTTTLSFSRTGFISLLKKHTSSPNLKDWKKKKKEREKQVTISKKLDSTVRVCVWGESRTYAPYRDRKRKAKCVFNNWQFTEKIQYTALKKKLKTIKR